MQSRIVTKVEQTRHDFKWHQEYAGYMVEGIPAAPYTFAFEDIAGLEANMRAQTGIVNQVSRYG